MTITKRGDKGSALTYNEMDENIRDLFEDTDLNRVITNGNTAGNTVITTDSVSVGDTTGSNFNIITKEPIRDRNLIINGDMRIWQRTTANTALVDTGSGRSIPVDYFSADRWGWSWNETPTDTLTAGDLRTKRSTDVPSGEGFKYSILLEKFNNGNSGTGNFADPLNPRDDRVTSNHLMQHIEGYMVQHLMWGTDDAKPITLSFWVKASQAKKLAVGFLLDDTNKAYFTTTQINAVDTWEKKVVTIQGSTDYAINDDAGKGLSVVFSIMSGNEGTVTADTWQDTNVFGGVLHPNVADSFFFEGTPGNIRFTGIQLEVGENATGFEFLNYDTIKHKCERYFRQGGLGADFNNDFHGGGMAIRMRATPAIYTPHTYTPTYQYRIDTSFGVQGILSGTNYATPANFFGYQIRRSSAGRAYWWVRFSLEAEIV